MSMPTPDREFSYNPQIEPLSKSIRPVYYVCTHRRRESGCPLWSRHSSEGYPLDEPVTDDTICPECGHEGTLVPEN